VYLRARRLIRPARRRGRALVTYRIVSSSFPNWEGEAQTRTIDKLTADQFVNTNPNVAGGRGSASNFYRRAK